MIGSPVVFDDVAYFTTFIPMDSPTTTDACKAMRRGYGASIVVSEYKGKRSYQADGLRVIPCPQTTGKAPSCESCKLCWNDTRLRETRTVIAFEAHGSGARKARAAISQSQQ